MTATTDRETLWASRTEILLEQALYEVRSNIDPTETISAADAAYRIACGELPAEELEELFEEEEEEN